MDADELYPGQRALDDLRAALSVPAERLRQAWESVFPPEPLAPRYARRRSVRAATRRAVRRGGR